MIARVLYLIARLIGRPLAFLALLSAAIIVTARIYAHHLTHPPTVADAERLNLTIAGILAAAAAVWLVRRASRWFAFLSPLRSHPTSLGGARWGSARCLESPRGYIVGRGGRWRRPLLRYAGDAHILTLAPTGAGKGVSCVIPTLLDYLGSTLVIDPKGENYAVTADYRRSIGHTVVALDPFGLVGGTGSFNPMESLDVADPACVDDAAALAEMLVVRDPRASTDTMFWSEEAKALIAGLILLVAESGGMHTMATLWEILSVSPRDLTKLWRMMAASTGAGGAIQRAGDRVLQKADRVRSSVIAEAQSHLHFLESPRLADVMSSSSFSFSDLKTSPTTVYLIVPPDRLDVCRRWLRLMVASALNALIRTPGMPAHRVLFLLDEFPALGPMPPLERAVSLARGYGGTCWLLAQDLSQLRALYPVSWSSFIANAGVLQAFGTSDLETATYLSAMIGTTTARAAGTTRSQRTGPGALLHGRDTRESWSESEHARPLLSPGEVRQLSPDAMILLMPGTDPIRVTRPDYRHDMEFRHRFAPNPMHASVALTNRSHARR
jgi:type IV secretion system protein VirD4